jgi:hypothetical protein
MKQTIILLALVAAASAAHAVKPCEELKTEIAAKLDAKGVKGAALDIVETDKVGQATVIGSCDGGSKKITYAKK